MPSLEQRQKEFKKEMEALLEKYNMVLIGTPYFMPDEKGGFRVATQVQAMPKPSEIVKPVDSIKK